MRTSLFALLILAAALIHPTTARADTTDLFTITGDSHTYTFTLPEQFTFPVSLHLVTVPPLATTGTINGVGSKAFEVTFFTGIGGSGESLTFNDITLAGPRSSPSSPPPARPATPSTPPPSTPAPTSYSTSPTPSKVPTTTT